MLENPLERPENYRDLESGVELRGALKATDDW